MVESDGQWGPEVVCFFGGNVFGCCLFEVLSFFGGVVFFWGGEWFWGGRICWGIGFLGVFFFFFLGGGGWGFVSF